MFGFNSQPATGAPPAVANIAALTAIPVLNRVETGAEVLVLLTRTGGGAAQYILEPAISTTPDGLYVVATADDATRQWVLEGISDFGIIQVVSAEISFTAIQTVQVLPPMNYRTFFALTPAYDLTVRDGTVTTGPTAQCGTDAGITSIFPSGVQAALAGTPTVNSRVLPTGTVTSLYNQDMSTNGLRFQITVGATLGTATQLKGRIMTAIGFARFP